MPYHLTICGAICKDFHYLQATNVGWAKDLSRLLQYTLQPQRRI